MGLLFVSALLVILTSPSVVRSDASNHKYKSGDLVPLYVNKVGPFQNPRSVDSVDLSVFIVVIT